MKKRDWTPQMMMNWQVMVRSFGADGTATRVVNALWRNGVTTMETFQSTPLMDIRDMRSLGPKSFDRIREIRAQLGIVDEQPPPPPPPIPSPFRYVPKKQRAKKRVPQMRRVPPLMGVAEAAHCLEVGDEELKRMRFFDDSFPKPVAELECGPIWKAQDIRTYRNLVRSRERYLAWPAADEA